MAETIKKCELLYNMWAGVKKKDSNKNDRKIKFIYDDDCLSRTQVFALHKKFLEGRETADS